jgi:crossover junction endodeoxyribonuclease RuvC
MVKNKFIIGIDPGRNGGIVGLTNGKINIIDKMPLNPIELWGYFIDDLAVPMVGKDNIYVFIEDVHSMPTDGVKSAFTFGRGLGWLDMCLARWDLHTERVLPRKWQKYFSLQRARDEGESKYSYKKRIQEKSKTLVPHDKEKRLTLATCDAYLIALYGYQTLKEREKSNGN